MVRVRIGEGWALDPEVQSGLRAPRAADRREAVRALVDVVAIEVEGVDIASGRTEGPLASTVRALVEAVARLAAGADHASVPFDDGSVELLLHRRGGLAMLSVASLSRPSRLIAHDVEVDLPHLAEAVKEAARAFCHRISTIAPGAATLPEVQALLRAATRRPVPSRPGVPARPGSPARRTRRRRREATCSFEIHDEGARLATWRGPGADLASLLVPGRVSIRAPDGTPVLELAGAPFLLFRDLCAAATRIASGPAGPVLFSLAGRGRGGAIRVEVSGGAVRVGSGPAVRCDPLALAHAILEGASDLCAVFRRRAPSQAGNELLVDLERSATAGLAEVEEARTGDRRAATPRRVRTPRVPRPAAHPLAAGTLRRVAFRRVASAEVGAPVGPGIRAGPEVALASGRDRVVALDARRGTRLWSAPGGESVAADGGLVAIRRGGTVECRDAASGVVAWTRPCPLGDPATATLLLVPGPRLLVSGGAELVALDARGGERLWGFASPGAARLSILPLGALLVVGSSTGLVHALDAAGLPAWRLRGAGPLSTPPRAGARAVILCFASPVGGVATAVDPSTGARIFDAPIDFVPSGPPVRFAGRIAVAGRVAGDAFVAALEEDGRPAWLEPSPVPGVPALLPRPGGLLAKGADGSCASLDRAGRVAWLRAREGRPVPPGNLAPALARGTVFVPAEEVELLDAGTGGVVGRVPAHAPVCMTVGDDLTTWTVDAEGLVEGARLRGHLSIVPGGRAG